MSFIYGNKCQAVPFHKSKASVEDYFVHLHIFFGCSLKTSIRKVLRKVFQFFELGEENN